MWHFRQESGTPWSTAGSPHRAGDRYPTGSQLATVEHMTEEAREVQNVGHGALEVSGRGEGRGEADSDIPRFRLELPGRLMVVQFTEMGIR